MARRRKKPRRCLSKTEKTGVSIQTAGDAKVDNRKFKDKFAQKAKMLSPEEVVQFTGHAIGGVCAFGITNDKVKIYCDESMKRFQTVFPACGSDNSAIEFTCDELFKYSNALEWIDVCKLPQIED
ncbi:MAG: YbaK/EbsC family protein [Anaerovoracaceae bacterium]